MPVNEEELEYLKICKRIIVKGNVREDRTGVGTFSLFGVQSRYSLRNGKIPLLTTKRMYWKGIVEELLWMISGCTDANVLAAKGVHIWDANATKEFLQQVGQGHRDEGDLGPVYGFQWRHFGAEYKTCKTDYTGQGIDQLNEVIEKIRSNPIDRRLIVSAWNPSDLSQMALPPCHLMFQFYVHNEELSCQMYQRSADMGLGVPFNIASYSLLTHMIAHVTGLKAGEFVHTIGDAHIYTNHVDALTDQIEREPRSFPTLRIRRQVPTIDEFQFDDFELINYTPYSRITLEMAV